MKEHDPVVLTHDIPEHGLKEGDVGAVVHPYAAGEGFEVEFVRASGADGGGAYAHPGGSAAARGQ